MKNKIMRQIQNVNNDNYLKIHDLKVIQPIINQ